MADITNAIMAVLEQHGLYVPIGDNVHVMTATGAAVVDAAINGDAEMAMLYQDLVALPDVSVETARLSMLMLLGEQMLPPQRVGAGRGVDVGVRMHW